MGARPNYIPTVSGGRVYLDRPDPADIDIRDIAHGLSNVCRFGGQCAQFYSVAQHSVLVSDLCGADGNARHALAGLLHDASEAYTSDVPTPVKDFCLGLRDLEDRLMRAIALKFDFTYPLARMVKTADRSALGLEWAVFMPDQAYPYNEILPGEMDVAPFGLAGGRIDRWQPNLARNLFLDRFNHLVHRIKGDRSP